MQSTDQLKSLSDDELLQQLAALLRESRRVEADLVAHVGEVDERRLYAREAAPSMFVYCTEILHLSEAEAYLRITVARAAREHPMLLAMLADGRLHLTGAAKLAPHLTPQNRDRLLARAACQSKRQIEELVAELVPRPDTPAVMRKLPERRVGTPAPAHALELRPDGVGPLAQLRPGPVETPPLRLGPAADPAQIPSATLEPLAPGRYRVQFTASAELREKLERLRALVRSSVPDGDLAAVIDLAITEKLERLESRRFARTKAPRETPSKREASHGSRHIPAAVRRAVHERDGGRCRYVDEQGRRCTGRDRLEFHHRHPYGHGGDHSVENIRLMCHAHNRRLAEIDYGRERMDRHRRPRGRAVPTQSSPPGRAELQGMTRSASAGPATRSG
jgi:5-methylcytosine-specific restriction endonuclease McrA